VGQMTILKSKKKKKKKKKKEKLPRLAVGTTRARTIYWI
jgi:hypothetical protein